MKNQPFWPEEDAKLFLQAMHKVGSMGGIAEIEPITMKMMEPSKGHRACRFIRKNIRQKETQATPSNPHSSCLC
jgi:hypothetical protein